VPSATLVRANFLLGQPAEARKTAWQLWRQHSVEDLDDLQPLEDICGQYWFGDPAWLAQLRQVNKPDTRLLLLARYARGAFRNQPGYHEPT
jgi:hypothetical protein